MSLGYTKAHRLIHARQFQAVYGAKVRGGRGPIVVFGLPNELPHARLGLSVPRAVGTAVKRNRIKRLLREAFRMKWRDWPGGYDLVVTVRPHETLTLEEYQSLLRSAVERIHKEWASRAAQ